MVLDNLSAHKGTRCVRWSKRGARACCSWHQLEDVRRQPAHPEGEQAGDERVERVSFRAEALDELSVEAVVPLGHLRGYRERLRDRLLHPRLYPLDLVVRFLLAGVNDLQKLPIAGALGGLPDHHPSDVAGIRHQVQVVQVAQKPQRAAPGLVEELVVELLGLLRFCSS